MPWDTVTQNPSGDVLAVVAEEEVADGLARARRLASCEEGAKPYTLLCEANPQLQPCPKLLTLRLTLTNDITCEEWGEAILGEGDLLDGVE